MDRVKRRKASVLMICAAVLVCAAVVLCACGGSGGVSKGEKFTLGDYNYAIVKWQRDAKKDTPSTECYGLWLAIEGDEMPIIITNGQATSGVDAKVMNGDEEISQSSISLMKSDEVEGYGAKAIFYFDIPKDSDLPTSGTLINNTNKEETVELDLSGLEVDE